MNIDHNTKSRRKYGSFEFKKRCKMYALEWNSNKLPVTKA